MKTETLFKREIRLLGFKQKTLALRLGVTKQSVSRWCKGRTLIPANMVTELERLGVSKKAIADPTKEV